MPKRQYPEGAGAVRDQLQRIGKATGWNVRSAAKLTGLSEYKTRQAFKAIREGKAMSNWIPAGTRGEKSFQRIKSSIERSGVTTRRTKDRETGKYSIKVVPPKPTKGNRYAKKTGENKKTGRRSYKWEPGKRIPIPPGADIQIRAKGKGKSKKSGKKITRLHSNVGDWESAWSSFQANMTKAGFVARDIEIIVYGKAEK